MASYRSLGAAAAAVLVVLCLRFVEGQSAEVECRTLDAASCAFAVDSSGARCLLETSTAADLTTVYSCQASEILAGKTGEYVESDECVSACGVDRMTVGISTDIFFNPGFAQQLCSIECQKCGNIVDLYSNVVSAAAGGSLARFCLDVQATEGLRRDLKARQLSTFDLMSAFSPSSSATADAPIASVDASAPTALGIGTTADAPTAEVPSTFDVGSPLASWKF